MLCRSEWTKGLQPAAPCPERRLLPKLDVEVLNQGGAKPDTRPRSYQIRCPDWRLLRLFYRYSTSKVVCIPLAESGATHTS
jgi:hypothetical protein